jgi:large subunit ribosomal protein L14
LANKPARIIGILGTRARRGRYKYAELGDKVTVAIRGQKKLGYVVGVKLCQRPLVPKFDTNNLVLIEKNGMPTGKRVTVPIPSCLRKQAGGEFSKIIAITSKFY